MQTAPRNTNGLQKNSDLSATSYERRGMPAAWPPKARGYVRTYRKMACSNSVWLLSAMFEMPGPTRYPVQPASVKPPQRPVR